MLTSLLPVSKSLWSYNPIPNGCIFWSPFWDKSQQSLVYTSADPLRATCTRTGGVMDGQGFTGDGDDDIVTSAAPPGLPTGVADRTILIWFKDTDRTGLQAVFFYGESAALKANLIFLAANSGVVTFSINTQAVTHTVAPTLSEFSFIFISVSGTAVEMGVNGVYESKVIGDTPNTSSSVLYIASRLSAGLYFIGGIGEVVVYDRLLTRAEGDFYERGTEGRYR